MAPLAPHVREPLTVGTAHDILLALGLLEVYRELHDRGWSNARYQAWLGRALREQVLGADGAEAGSAGPHPRAARRELIPTGPSCPRLLSGP